MQGNATETFVRDIPFLCREFAAYNDIPPALAEKFPVKKGLRNPDGTGVLAGVTKICNVHGYMMSEGEKVPVDGELIYRGVNVAELISGCVFEGRSAYEETCYLLLLGHLPNREQLDHFVDILSACRALPPHFTEDMVMKAASLDIMNMLARCVLALYPYDEHPEGDAVEDVMRQSIDLIARMPMIMAHAYQTRKRVYDNRSMYLHHPAPALSTAENILRLLRRDKQFTPDEARVLDVCLTLHAEHGGGNNSTFAVRSITSAATDTYSAIAAGIGALKGRRHGGANYKVGRQLAEMKESLWDDGDEAVRTYLRQVVRKEKGDGSGLIYGMGHAVYTKSDPRAVILKQYAQEMAVGTDFERDFCLLAAIERLAPEVLQEVWGSERTVCGNIDLYSGFVYRMLGIPEELHTPLFACARTVGWCAHRLEEMFTCNKIYRPAYKSVSREIPYTPLSGR